MADDDVPDGPDREPAREPKRPLTPQDKHALARQKEDEERKARIERIKTEHRADIEYLLDIKGIQDPEIRALATGFIAENIGAQRNGYNQLAQGDRLDIAEKSIGQAYEEERRQRTAENEEAARQNGDQTDRGELPDEVARSKPTKEEEPERQRESDSGKEVTESKAARKAKLQERFDSFDKAQQETFSRDHGERGRD